MDAAPPARIPNRSDRGPIELCPHCGGTLRVIACIDDPKLIETILAHIAKRDGDSYAQPRAPPARALRLPDANAETLDPF